MKKALIVTSVASMIYQFLLPNIALLKEIGYKVDVACNFEFGSSCGDEQVARLKSTLNESGVGCYQIGCSRSITKVFQNIKAGKELKKLVEANGYDLVHCHTPIGGMLTRLACRKARKKRGLKVFYTAHGFHFYKGAPKKNWCMFYPVERFCSRFTDVLLTINKEDYETANRKLKAKKIEYVPGVGIDTKKIKEISVDVAKKREEIGVPLDAFLLLSVGELNENKNHITVINAIKEIKEENIYYVIVGKGNKKEELLKRAKELGLEDRVKVLGFRTDVFELCKSSNVFVHPSFREGLPVAIMEAMATGLPVIASKIRGCKDLIDEFGGVLCNPFDHLTFKDAILSIKDKCEAFGKYNLEKIKNYDQEVVNQELIKIYEGVDNNVKTNV